MTRSEDKLQEEVAGTALRDTMPWLTLALRTMPVALGVHVNESCAIPVPEVAAKVIVRGLAVHVAFGTVL